MSTTPGIETAPPQVPAPPHVPVPSAPHSSATRTPYAFERGLTGVEAATSPLSSERIAFTAACPACGHDTSWLQVREDTRIRSVVHCGCEAGQDA